VLSQLIAATDPSGAPLYDGRIYDCWIDYGKPAQRPLWPEQWPAERLKRKERQMGKRVFNQEMRNLTSDEDSPFKERDFIYYAPEDLKNRTMDTVTFVDPSAKSNEQADYKSAVTVSMDRLEMIFFVRHAWIRRASISEMFGAAYDQFDAYGPRQTGIEENMFQDFLHSAIQNYARDAGRYLPWMPVYHSSNKIGRIVGTLQYLIEHGKLRFLRDHSDQQRLVEQLIYILNDNINDDGPDALEGAVSLLQQGGGVLVA